MFGLYGDLPAAKDAGDAPEAKPSWTAGLATQLKPAPRKPAVHGPPPATLRAAHARPAAPPPRPAAASAAAVTTVTAPSPSPAPAAASVPSLLGSSADEYDPSRPNSYEEAARQRALKRKQEELDEKRRALERQRQELAARRKSAVQAAQEQYAHLPLPPPPPLPPPAAQQPLPPPPPLPQRLPSPPHEAQPAPARGMTAAQRMMEKMGWREGQNLGKSEPTRVLCLRGMVGRGEVDEALEDEVADECEKHGPVVRVLIFEVTDAACPPDAAVRIFVQFVKLEGAVKALAEMDGRFFGGRVVRASFYSEARFDAQDIAPAPGDYT